MLPIYVKFAYITGLKYINDMEWGHNQMLFNNRNRRRSVECLIYKHDT